MKTLITETKYYIINNGVLKVEPISENRIDSFEFRYVTATQIQSASALVSHLLNGFVLDLDIIANVEEFIYENISTNVLFTKTDETHYKYCLDNCKPHRHDK